MVYKLLKDGEVVNTIVASPAFVDAYADQMGYTYEQLPEVEEVLPVPELTTEERLAALEDRNAEMTEALDLLLSGVTE